MREAQAATAEVGFIRSRHGGVHAIHSIACCFLGYESLLIRGTWSQKLQRNFVEQLVRARVIDKTGFDKARPFRSPGKLRHLVA
jgi:hypothetical protein